MQMYGRIFIHNDNFSFIAERMEFPALETTLVTAMALVMAMVIPMVTHMVDTGKLTMIEMKLSNKLC